MKREQFYNDVTKRYTIRVSRGNRSLQMSFGKKEFENLNPHQVEDAYRFLENKLAAAER